MLESRDIFVVDVRPDTIKMNTRDSRWIMACTHIYIWPDPLAGLLLSTLMGSILFLK